MGRTSFANISTWYTSASPFKTSSFPVAVVSCCVIAAVCSFGILSEPSRRS
ncbi:hypothetical protein PGT21_035771 [Puccinia graminis f. sp. tritici]|uniref:Uncharacterized protein n=1 Tax=Puccinia graminis f. sp. tritici TaxID=56615 RepID=A0A5B0R3N2_PUCGR|nr:hypothetical protein PGT21_035771 [Puccinia graminis f. sp. tritici]